jgi:hypothetical protein
MIILNRAQLFSHINLEQRLLISLCSKQNIENREEARLWLSKPFNWEKLILLSERHRVLPLFYKNIKECSSTIPIEIPTIFKEKYIYQTRHALKLASEGIRVSGLLNQESISNILLKGPFLSKQFYDDAGLRPSRDIDILVTAENIEKVNDILASEGYRKIYPDFELSKKQKSFYQKNKNQYAYRNSENGCLIELHWRLFSQKDLLPVPTEILFAESQELMMAGKSIKVLSNKHNFEYLSLHGSMHQWFRLLWLRDIAQMIEEEKVNVDELLSCAKENRNERPIEQAIYLSNLFFGTALALNVKAKEEVKNITNHAITAIISDESLTLSHKISRLRFPIYKMKLKPGIKYKLSCWSILQPNFNDWKIVKLPDVFFFGYFLLRPFIWFYTFYLSRKSGTKN